MQQERRAEGEGQPSESMSVPALLRRKRSDIPRVGTEQRGSTEGVAESKGLCVISFGEAVHQSVEDTGRGVDKVCFGTQGVGGSCMAFPFPVTLGFNSTHSFFLSS